jgi:hypothetical protein
MSGNSQPIYYWDACVYLAWLLKEQSHGPDCINAMAQIASENFQLKNILFTSVITRIEVLESKLSAEQSELFKKTFRSTNHILYDVDPPIADKARQFRQNVRTDTGKVLAVPDAIHLATAATYGAHQVHTFDDGQQDKRSIGLLELSGRDCVGGIVICKPNIPQGTLPLAASTPPATLL